MNKIDTFLYDYPVSIGLAYLLFCVIIGVSLVLHETIKKINIYPTNENLITMRDICIALIVFSCITSILVIVNFTKIPRDLNLYVRIILICLLGINASLSFSCVYMYIKYFS